jgi:hypothetical protein
MARCAVQVMSADGREIYGLFFTLQVERAPLQSQAAVRFASRKLGHRPPSRRGGIPMTRPASSSFIPKVRRVVAQRSPARMSRWGPRPVTRRLFPM